MMMNAFSLSAFNSPAHDEAHHHSFCIRNQKSASTRGAHLPVQLPASTNPWKILPSRLSTPLSEPGVLPPFPVTTHCSGSSSNPTTRPQTRQPVPELAAHFIPSRRMDISVAKPRPRRTCMWQTHMAAAHPSGTCGGRSSKSQE
jgi:hypothetical protein